LDTIAGQFTNVKPHAPLHAVLVGYCITSTTDGTIFVKIQNGYELEELHDVLITSPTNGQTIRYLADSLYWKNDSIIKASDVGIINTVNIADSSIVYDKLSQALKDSLSGYQGNITLTTTGTSGAATFSNDTLNIPQYSGSTDLSFSGSSSPVTLNSSTGTDVTINAGDYISLSATSSSITINSETELSFVQQTTARSFVVVDGITTLNLPWDGNNVIGFIETTINNDVTLTVNDTFVTFKVGPPDGYKGDITVVNSTWTINDNVVGESKLGPLFYVTANDVNIDLGNYSGDNLLSKYAQIVVWLRIVTDTITVTIPTPAVTYKGRFVEIFFGDVTDDNFFGQITSGGSNRITYRDGATVTTTTTYDGNQSMKYAKIICMEEPNSSDYQWVILDSRL
jgi:hypothetical protein